MKRESLLKFFGVFIVAALISASGSIADLPLKKGQLVKGKIVEFNSEWVELEIQSQKESASLEQSDQKKIRIERNRLPLSVSLQANQVVLLRLKQGDLAKK